VHRPNDKPTIARVFVSSTVEDLRNHRSAVRDAIIRAEAFPEMQEYFTASSYNPPLDECLCRVRTTDVLIVIVAQRYGWVPEDQKSGEYKSITWLEVEEAVRNSKEVLAFVLGDNAEWPKESSESYRLALAAERGEATAELVVEVQRNVHNLNQFKKWLKHRSICGKFTNAESLKADVEAALRVWHARHREFASSPIVAPIESQDPRVYLEQLREQTAWIDIRGLQVSSGKAHRFSIEDLYIPLTAVQGSQVMTTWGRLVDAPEQIYGGIGRPDELQAALTYPKLVIVGDPGAGKTTFLRRIAFALSDSLLKSESGFFQQLSSSTSAPLEEEKNRQFIGRLMKILGRAEEKSRQHRTRVEAPFPILIRITELAEHIERSLQQIGRIQPTTRESPDWLLDFLNTRNRELNWLLRIDFFRDKLKNSSCVVLLDGLDEASRRSERESMSRLFEQATKAYPGCRFVVTTRPLAYTGQTVLEEFQTARIEPIEPKAIRTFLNYWCKNLFPNSETAAMKHLAELSDALQSPEIRKMASNPVMLTALAVVHWNERRLPEQRWISTNRFCSGSLALERSDRGGHRLSVV
jgi:hypothetical protein